MSNVLVAPSCTPSDAVSGDCAKDAGDGFLVTGFPLGTTAFVDDFLVAEANEQIEASRKLKAVLGDDRQSVYHLLASCVAKEFVHFARRTPSLLLENFACKHNRRLRDFVKDMFNLPMVHWRSVQLQTHQPVRAAGLVIAAHENVAVPAYYLSCAPSGKAVARLFNSFRAAPPSPPQFFEDELNVCIKAAASLCHKGEAFCTTRICAR